jgi:drug/metabolite transporter (DMT)-like permease
MKMGMNSVKPLNFQGRFVSELLRIVTNKFVILGVLTYIIGTFLWLYVLSKMELSLSYPMLSVSYALIAIVSWLLLGESMTLSKIIGILIISIGVFVLYR